MSGEFYTPLWVARIYLVAKSPNGDTNAALDLRASANGISVVASLRLQVGRGRRQSHMNIQLCKRNFHAQRGESFHIAPLSLETRSAASNAEVGLNANAIDLDSPHLERLDKVASSV